MADYQRPAKRNKPQGDINQNAADHEQIRRDHTTKDLSLPLVKLGSEAAESWPPGTAWLKTT